MSKVLIANNVSKRFGDGAGAVTVLQNAQLEVSAGEQVAILGASGSGKSTLLHILGGLDTADAGSVSLGGQDWAGLHEPQRSRWRNEAVGVVYQFHHLLPEFTALENVAMPLLWRGLAKAQAFSEAAVMLAKVGLTERLSHTPAMLSGGERQRTAIARALVSKPKILLADEPTGNLDRDNASTVFDLCLELAKETQLAMVLVTHDETLAARCSRRLRMVSGALIDVA